MARKSTKKKSRFGGLFLVFLVLAVTMLIGFFFASHKTPDAEKKTIGSVITDIIPSVKTAITQNEDINLSNNALEAQRTIDEILMKHPKWQLSDDGREDKKMDRPDNKGEVLWVQRKLLVGIPHGDDLKKAAELICERIRLNNLVVVDKADVTYVKDDAIKITVGLTAKVGEANEVTVVTDEITVFNGDQTSEKSKEIEKEQVKQLQTKKLKGKMAVVVDDCGYSVDPVKTLSSLPIEMSFAIIPFKDNSTQALNIIKSNGKLAMLHLPMEPLNSGEASETRMVTTTMTKDQIQSYVREAVNSLPGIRGVNNHQGSKATSSSTTMKAVMEVLKSNGLFFVDSNTTGNSIGDQIASQYGVRTGRNEKFLDNSSDVGEITKQIWAAANIANRDGYVIVICHARPNTAKAWADCYKDIQSAGITFEPVNSVLK